MFSLKELWEKELFPVGEFETLPVTVTKNIPFNQYPSVVEIFNIPEYKTLYKEYCEFKKNTKLNPNRYIKERIRFLKLDPKEWSKLFESYGFNSKEYETYSMRLLGTNLIKDDIGDYTKSIIKSLPVETFRQQYAVAHPGWKTKPHIDTDRLDLHGFRVMIPLNTTFNIGFDEGIYNLEPGVGYFINVSKMHYGINNQNETRVNIMLHLASDSIIDFSKKIKIN